MHNIWYGYFWPSLRGNGPEALFQTVVYALIAVTFVPVVRRFEKRMHAKFDRAIALSEHIIKHHPDIPNLPKGDK